MNNVIEKTECSDNVSNGVLHRIVEEGATSSDVKIAANLLTEINDSIISGNMFKGIDRTNVAQYRKSVVWEYIRFMKGFSPAQKAQLLVDYANAKGWTEHYFMTGTRLDELKSSDSISAWIVNSAFELMMHRGWVPTEADSTDTRCIQTAEDTFALFIFYWMQFKGPFFSVDEVLDSLPVGIDLVQSEEWVRFFIARLGITHNRKLNCYLVDKDGEALSKNHHGLIYLARYYGGHNLLSECSIVIQYTSLD